MANHSGKLFSLHIFQTMEEAQSSHGVPHQDYAQYQAYCTKRLYRLRHVKPVRSLLVHNHKYVEGVSGRRHAYCPRNEMFQAVNNEEGEEAVPHENIFWNLFFQAERAWAQACALQHQQPASGKSSHSCVQRRLNKAKKWANALVEIVSDKCDEITIKESQAYAAWMLGNAALEHKDYVAAFRHYKESMVILEELAESIETSAAADALAIRDTWTTRAETVLRPLVRYCQYEAKDKLTADDLQETVATTIKEDTASSIVLRFRGKEIALDADPSYKQIAVLYLKMESSLKHPESLDDTHFLQLLSDLDDAVQLVVAELKQYESITVAGPAVKAKIEDLQAVQGFFSYQKLSIWRHQQEQRVAELDNDAEIVHVYDALRQNAMAMADLPVDEEDPFWLEAQAHMVRIRAFRCYYLARLYESTLNGTCRQVLALLRQSEKLTKRATEEIAACDMEEIDHHLVALDNLLVKIKAMTCRVEATKYLESTAVGGIKTERPLWLRIEDLDAGDVLADDPPLPIPMPCKGAFYDVAWQYVGGDFPLQRIQEYIAENEPKKSSFLGWFGK